MMAEDAVDRYVVKPLERKVQNPVLRLIVLGVLNPNRSFSNALRFKRPWHRDSRGGVAEP